MGLNHVPWYNIAVDACNRVSPRVTCWPHLIHLKVYKEESPGKRRVVLSPLKYRTAVIFQVLIPTLNAFQTSGGINL
jgi:hypothetical protein